MILRSALVIAICALSSVQPSRLLNFMKWENRTTTNEVKAEENYSVYQKMMMNVFGTSKSTTTVPPTTTTPPPPVIEESSILANSTPKLVKTVREAFGVLFEVIFDSFLHSLFELF